MHASSSIRVLLTKQVSFLLCLVMYASFLPDFLPKVMVTGTQMKCTELKNLFSDLSIFVIIWDHVVTQLKKI